LTAPPTDGKCRPEGERRGLRVLQEGPKPAVLGRFLTDVPSQGPREQPSIREAKASVREAKAKSAKVKNAFINKHCRSEVSEEWKKVDDQKIAKLRGILNALQEENQSTQLLKKESENKAAKQELDATRSSVQVRLGAVKEKEELFHSREAELQAHVQENEKSLHELETNIEKGEKKAKDELVECKRLDKEIESLQAEFKEHEGMKEDQQKKITLFSRYKKFLEMVVMEQETDFEGDVEVLINRHNTLEAGNKELFQANSGLTSQLDRVRDECQRVQTRLQNEHLRISSQLHECQVNLDKHRAESQELEARLNRALEEKELKESKVGVIQMAIEQLFSRTLASLKLNPSKKGAKPTAVDNKFQPVLGDKNDVKLDDMLRQIVERMEDLREILEKSDAALKPNVVEHVHLAEEVELKVHFAQSHEGGGGSHREHAGDSEQLTAGSSTQLGRRLQSDASGASGGNSQAKLSKDFSGRGDDGLIDE